MSMNSFNNRVTMRPPYGPPHKVVMNLTLMVKYRALAQRTPVIEMFRLGSIESIAEELRLLPSPTNSNVIKQALQRIVEETRGKEHTYRQVFFPGDDLPDGRKADAVYIILSKAYVEFLEHARVTKC
jgi:hypothetical protein